MGQCLSGIADRARADFAQWIEYGRASGGGRVDHDAIDIPESTREAWQRAVDILADIIEVPAAVIVRTPGDAEVDVFVASRSEGNACIGGEATMGLPLTWPDGESFGAICIMDTRENRYSARYERLLGQIQEIVNLHLSLLFQQHDLREKTRIDALTGACTRRDFFDSGGIELKRARRYGIPLCLLLLDFDHFKAINDAHGHAFGDAVLKHMTRLIMGSLRSSDRYYRLGGEEFVALLPHSELEGAQLVAERTRALVEARPLEFRGEVLPVTLSIGVARLEGAGESLDDLLAKADRALYLAKANGRNRVEMFERLTGVAD